MKVKGLTATQIHTALAPLITAHKLKVMGLETNDTGVSFYLSLKASANPLDCQCIVTTGQLLYKPAAPLYAKAVKSLLMAGAIAVWAEKHKFVSFHLNIELALKFALQKKGIGTYAEPQAPKPSPSPIPTSPAPVVTGPKWWDDLTPLPGEMPEGECAAVPKGILRDVFVAVCTMYTLEECRAQASVKPAKRLDAHGGIAERLWRRQVEQYTRRYQARFAHNLFDYLTVASIGEARHAHKALGVTGNPTSRSALYLAAHRHDPRQLIPASLHVFKHWLTGGSYGGPKWAKIAETAGKYLLPMFHAYPVVYADHCVDLAHNGGLCFNKGYIFAMPSAGEPEYMAVLDSKRKGSLLQDEKRKLKVSRKAYFLLREAEAHGVVTINAHLESVDDPEIPTIKWDGKPLGTEVPMPAVSPAEAQAHVVAAQLKSQLVETYPTR